MQIESAVREVTIRERAYAIWEREGRPQGRELDHWIKAIREIAAPAPPVAAEPAPRRRAAKGRSRTAALAS